MVTQPSDAIGRHHMPGCFIRLTAPIEVAETEIEAEFSPDGPEHIKAFGYDLFPDTVAGDHCYAVSIHWSFFPMRPIYIRNTPFPVV